MIDVAIRVERPDDYDAIATVVESAFGSPAEARLVEAIRSSEFAIAELSLVAERDGRVVGHTMISLAEVDDGADRHPIAMLSPLAVHPDEQRQGIGSRLVRTVTTRAAAAANHASCSKAARHSTGDSGSSRRPTTASRYHCRRGRRRRRPRFCASAPSCRCHAAVSSIRRRSTSSMSTDPSSPSSRRRAGTHRSVVARAVRARNHIVKRNRLTNPRCSKPGRE